MPERQPAKALCYLRETLLSVLPSQEDQLTRTLNTLPSVAGRAESARRLCKR